MELRKREITLTSLSRKFIPKSWKACPHWFREYFEGVTCLYCGRSIEEIRLLEKREEVRRMAITRVCKGCGEQVDVDDFSSEETELCIYCEEEENALVIEDEEEEEDED